MAFHNELGRKGEAIAADYLRQHGYGIIERNWRYGNLEIDIIARTEEEIVFVEVKTRSDDSFGMPEDAVDIQKRYHLTVAASHYIQASRCNLEPRFDVVAIVHNDHETHIEHFENAFYSTRRPRTRRRW